MLTTPWLHRFALLVAAATLILIGAGGLVTSTGSGLAVPDWPSTYGYFMFAFPLSKMVGGIFYEHGHRLIASTVGGFTIVLAAWLWRVERRRWLRWLGVLALAAVIAQGVLGGLTVLYFLPAPVSIGHAALAQLFFCLTVGIALFTAPGWLRGDSRVDHPALRHRSFATTAVIYGQILLGATVRHMDAGLAIPDFPLSFGRAVPPTWDAAIAVHFAHRAGAIVVALTTLATCLHVWSRHRHRRELVRPAIGLLVLVVVQIALGGWTVISQKAVNVNTAHVVGGAMLLATSLVLTLRAHRAQFGDRLDLQAADYRLRQGTSESLPEAGPAQA